MGTDGWKLSKAAEWLERGAVGVIPTDSSPALCCLLTDSAAVERLYAIKGIDAKKPLSIMCRCAASPPGPRPPAPGRACPARTPPPARTPRAQSRPPSRG